MTLADTVALSWTASQRMTVFAAELSVKPAVSPGSS